MDKEQLVDLTLLAAVIDRIPGKCIDVYTDTSHLVGKVIKAEELKAIDGGDILRIALIEEEGLDVDEPLPSPLPLITTESDEYV